MRRLLGTFLAFGALNAFAGGWFGLSGAPGVPTEWLDGSPFGTYFVPSLVLFFVVGGTLLLAAISVFTRSRNATLLSVIAGVILLGWIAIQVGIIGYVSWMQPATVIGAVLILGLASTLGSGESAAPPRLRGRARV